VSLLIRQALNGVFYFGGWWIILLLMVLVMALMPLIYVVADSRWIIIWSLAIGTGFFLPFVDYSNLWVGLGLLIMIAGFIIGGFGIKTEANTYLKLKWQRISRRGLSTFLIVFMLFIGVTSYTALKPTFSENGGWSQVLKFINFDFSKISFGKIKLNMTVDEFIESSAMGNVNTGGSNTMLQDVLGGLPKELVNVLPSLNLNQVSDEGAINKQMIASIRKEFSTKLGLKLKGDEKLSDLISQYTTNFFKSLPPTVKYLLYALIIISFVSLIVPLVWIFRWIAFFFSWIILQILLSIKYLKIDNIGVDKETLVIE